MTSLVIVESPAKCKKIASFLGPGYVVLATMGHIRALDEDIDAIGIDRDFEPRYRFLKEKTKATGPILEAAKNAKKIYLAADDDREGEAIAYSVACLLKCDPLTTPRAIFHEITAKAIKSAIDNPRCIDMNRVFAQQARAVLDMLVGFTISPILWKHVAKGLSAGRCQTPALRLVSEREASIKNHTMETTWALRGIFQGSFSFEAKMDDELEDQESSLNYLENIHQNTEAVINSVEQRTWTSNPPKPLITSSLQQEASALHKINPKITMKIAQELYEAGHITYMRTDHAIMCDEAIKAAHDEVIKLYGEEYISKVKMEEKPKAKPKSKANEKEKPMNSQEAHEAIRPTHFDLAQLTEDWSEIHKKIYTLIYRRAMQSTMSSATGQERTIKISLSGDTENLLWTAKWRITEFPGWQILGKPAKLDDEEEEGDSAESIWKKVQLLVKGTKISWNELEASPKRSKASPRFTEATLIRELEKKGIGRPSTFANLVEVLFDKSYIEKQDIPGTLINHTNLTIKPSEWPPLTQTTQIHLGSEKGKLVPTSLGESVVAFCLKEFPHLFAYDFTATMEARLDSVAKGDAHWKDLCRDTWKSYKGDYDRLNDKKSLPSSSEKVRDFGNGFKAVMSKTGPLLVQESKDKEKGKATFYTFPPDTSIQTITEEQARAWVNKEIEDTHFGTFDNKPIVKKKGPYGYYLQCGDLRIPHVSSETIEQVAEKFKERITSSNTYKFGPYTFGRGQYGQYMYKTALKTKVFVSVAEDIDVKTLTAPEADALYKSGIETKKANALRGGWKGRGGRGGLGGRGGKN